MSKIGINGLGRIGGHTLRLLSQEGLEVGLLNDPFMTPEALRHCLTYDTVHGKFDGVIATSDGVQIQGVPIKLTSFKEPDRVPWGDHGVTTVLECSGAFTDPEKAKLHLAGGAKRVILSAPAKGKVPTFVYGINHENLRPIDDSVVSTASCTTNALAPLAKVLNDNFGIEVGYMLTVHAATADQRLVDGVHSDKRRRRAMNNIIPSSTGAAKALGEVIPELAGKLHGSADRVPVLDGSIVHLHALVSKDVTADEVNEVFCGAAANGPLHGILSVSDDEWVSAEIIGTTFASVVDLELTKVVGTRFVHAAAWYDNEMSYIRQMVRFANYALARDEDESD